MFLNKCFFLPVNTLNIQVQVQTSVEENTTTFKHSTVASSPCKVHTAKVLANNLITHQADRKQHPSDEWNSNIYFSF